MSSSMEQTTILFSKNGYPVRIPSDFISQVLPMQIYGLASYRANETSFSDLPSNLGQEKMAIPSKKDFLFNSNVKISTMIIAQLSEENGQENNTWQLLKTAAKIHR